MTTGLMRASSKPVVLLTGGAGFVGSHVANGLARRWHVRVFDNLSNGSLANLRDHPDVSIHIGDIRSDADVRGAFVVGPIDAVVHCAAQTSVPLSMADPDFDREVNVKGTERLLRAARQHGVRRFVFMSSGGAIYGETQGAATEAQMPSPRSYYGLHKHVAEQLVRAEGISHAILRPSNIYGPRQRSDIDGGAIAIFLERLLAGEPIEIFGDGRQSRDFVYVDDVFRAVEEALAIEDDVIWNVSSGVSTSVRDVIGMLAGLTGAKPDLRYLAPRQGDVRSSLLARAALDRVLPVATSLADGLRMTLASIEAVAGSDGTLVSA